MLYCSTYRSAHNGDCQHYWYLDGGKRVFRSDVGYDPRKAVDLLVKEEMLVLEKSGDSKYQATAKVTSSPAKGKTGPRSSAPR